MALTLLRPMEVARRCIIGRSALFDLVRKGEFPQPVRVTARRIGFPETEVDAWLKARMDERSNSQEDSSEHH